MGRILLLPTPATIGDLDLGDNYHNEHNSDIYDGAVYYDTDDQDHDFPENHAFSFNMLRVRIFSAKSGRPIQSFGMRGDGECCHLLKQGGPRGLGCALISCMSCIELC